MITYIVNDKNVNTEIFLTMVKQVWPKEYDVEATAKALDKTINITAWDNGRLVGCLRILTDGCYFGTITELLVCPDHQRQGIGRHLVELAKENTPTTLYFGAQPHAVEFYEKCGCERGMTSFVIKRARTK